MNHTFKEQLRNELNYQGMLVKELSKKTGIPIPTLDCYLRRRSVMPSADTAVKIARALNVTVEYLVTGEKHFEENGERRNFLKKPVELYQIIETLKPKQYEAVINLLKVFRAIN